MTAFPRAKRLCLSSPADRALGLSEQICSIHEDFYASLDKRKCEIDMALDLVGFTIVEDVDDWGVMYAPWPCITGCE
jgi:hypothetical protein